MHELMLFSHLYGVVGCLAICFSVLFMFSEKSVLNPGYLHSDKSVEARHASSWINKKLPYSATPAQVRGKCGVWLFTAMQEVQALRDQLPLADSSKTPEEVFNQVMSQHETINTAAPSQAMLQFGRTHVCPAFAQSLSTLFQRDLTLTTAYALLKFGLQ
jgi:hypothetical protein